MCVAIASGLVVSGCSPLLSGGGIVPSHWEELGPNISVGGIMYCISLRYSAPRTRQRQAKGHVWPVGHCLETTGLDGDKIVMTLLGDNCHVYL